ncbi:katanin p80 WD40 repeat-containing subunit B1 homolog KTN80.2-like isoform X2 [Amaranthus tricolor]|uniref:katanin p80 WD40 repeat-containing subunit B1 homolog KTN80.2-like isoform X2 n=1 Tax=Amaranthus tricolor TaxID=29722 RepID=UPI00258D40F6|nr:katanin p80 WD40 repeat-containing subunit B1 homolog KTN80.2-like isoform X2 [Amaranthus tricolor]
MAKRGYKLQFVAHSSNVNCLRIGKKACRLLLTGGDDHKVNLWAIGKPTSLMSLCGHTTPVESLAFDSTEVLVLGGASSGTVKLWDLEEAKMVRTLTGHRANCMSIEFHPFGEFFASGSADTDLRIWDIRKKGCIHTYKGHTRGINNIKFTPDGRWVVSGGFDNVVKVWDLTAGKLLHDFKFHDGPIRSLDFHPLEFLLATGSADRTVKFWDLETFEMIGSARAEATGVRALTFHPDGRTLFCGYDNNLKVHSWEPVICHDSIDMGWTTLGDLCIKEGKLIGCSYYRNSVGVWAADLAHIEPYGTSDSGTPQVRNPAELKADMRDGHSPEVLSTVGSTFSSRSTSPDPDAKDIKNIYVDYEKPISSRKSRLHNISKARSSSDLKDTSKLSSKKQNTPNATTGTSTRTSGRSFVVPTFVPRESSGGKSLTNSRRESITPAKSGAGGSFKATHIRKSSKSKFNVDDPEPNFVDRLVLETGATDSSDGKSFANCRRESIISVRPGSGGSIKATLTRNSSKSKFDIDDVKSNFLDRLVLEVEESDENKNHSPASIEEQLENPSPPMILNPESVGDDNFDRKERQNVKVEGAIKVSHGRTRSLVEKFERRGRFGVKEDQTTSSSPDLNSDRIHSSTVQKEEPQISGRESVSANDGCIIEDLMQNHDVLLSGLRSRLTKLQMVRHLWERNDIKGAITALKKLPDHSVQADVVGVFSERMEIVTMDLFSCMLPILVGLLDSKMERHVKMSLELLLKLVACFGPTICSTISAPPSVGVDLHQEERIAACKQSFVELQQVQRLLPALARKGGSLARSALQLNLVLEDHSI